MSYKSTLKIKLIQGLGLNCVSPVTGIKYSFKKDKVVEIDARDLIYFNKQFPKKFMITERTEISEVQIKDNVVKIDDVIVKKINEVQNPLDKVVKALYKG